MRSFLIILAVGLGIYSVLQSIDKMGTGGAGHTPAGFLTSYTSALTRAKTEGKPVILVFSASWCPPCRMMRDKVYPSNEVAAFKDKFVWAYLDVDQPSNRTFGAKYAVQGIPHYEFLNSRGESVGNVVGGTDAGSFASILGSMLAKAH